jgi:hypothetical protein
MWANAGADSDGSAGPFAQSGTPGIVPPGPEPSAPTRTPESRKSGTLGVGTFETRNWAASSLLGWPLSATSFSRGGSDHGQYAGPDRLGEIGPGGDDFGQVGGQFGGSEGKGRGLAVIDAT